MLRLSRPQWWFMVRRGGKLVTSVVLFFHGAVEFWGLWNSGGNILRWERAGRATMVVHGEERWEIGNLSGTLHPLGSGIVGAGTLVSREDLKQPWILHFS